MDDADFTRELDRLFRDEAPAAGLLSILIQLDLSSINALYKQLPMLEYPEDTRLTREQFGVLVALAMSFC